MTRLGDRAAPAARPRGGRVPRAWLLLLLPLLLAPLLLRPVRTVEVERRSLGVLRWGSGAGQVGLYRALDGLWRGPTAVAADASGRPAVLDAVHQRLLLATGAGTTGGGGRSSAAGGGGTGWREVPLPGGGWYTALAPLADGWLVADGRSGALLEVRPALSPNAVRALLAAPDGRETRWRRILLLRGGPGATVVLAGEGGTGFVRRRLWLLEKGRLAAVAETGIRAPGVEAGGLILSAAPAEQGILLLEGGASPLSRQLVRVGPRGPATLFTLELRSPRETVDLLGELPGLGWLLWRALPGGRATLELRDASGARSWSASVAAGPPDLLHPAWLEGSRLLLLEPGKEGVRVEEWIFGARWGLAWRR